MELEGKLGLMSSEKESENCTADCQGRLLKKCPPTRWWQPRPSPFPELTRYRDNRDEERTSPLLSTPLSQELSYCLSLLFLLHKKAAVYPLYR